MQRLILIMLAAPTGACMSAAPPPAPALPTVVRLTPGTVTYRLIERRLVTQTFHGRPMVSEARMETALEVTLSATDSAFALVAVVESLSVRGDAGFPPGAAAGAQGVRLTASLTPTGELTDLAAPAGTNPVIDRLLLRLPDLLPRVPPDGAVPNTTWADSIESHGQTGGIPVTVRTRASHRSGGWIEQGATRVLPVTSHATYELSGEGRRDGQWISLTGHGRRVTHRVLMADGRIVEGSSADTLEAELSLPEAGAVIPVTQTSVDTVRTVGR